MPGIVIVGAGECGNRAALTLREEGYGGPVTLVGAETGEPYERPPLSKPDPEAPPRRVPVATAARFADLEIDFLPGRTAEKIDRPARSVRLTDGTVLRYDKLLLATGARPRRLTGVDDRHATVLRDFDDARRLFAGPVGRITLIGAGPIDLHLAAALRVRGNSVTVLETSDRSLGRSVPPELSARIVARHLEAGFDFRFGVAVLAIDPDAVILADGARIASDSIVLAVGVVPETALAETAGLATDDGIAVDAALRTSDPEMRKRPVGVIRPAELTAATPFGHHRDTGFKSHDTSSVIIGHPESDIARGAVGVISRPRRDPVAVAVACMAEERPAL